MKAGEPAMAMHVDYTNKNFFLNLFQFIEEKQLKSEAVICLGEQSIYDKVLRSFIVNNTLRQLILTFVDDKKFEFVEQRHIDALCKKIALADDRTASIIVDDQSDSPLFFKKAREIASAEDAWLILYLHHFENISTIMNSSSPDSIIFKYKNLCWLGFSTNIISKKLNDYSLPTGQTICHLHDYETEFVANEIFNEKCYDLDGLNLRQHATIFDIGANIGLFSIYCKTQLPNAIIYGFEPSINAYRALQTNLKPYTHSVDHELCAISNHNGEDYFHTYDDFSVISGLAINKENDLNTILTGIESTNHHISHKDLMNTKQYLETVYSYRCITRTISSIIEREQIKFIDLIKIDTEGSELNILKGINQHHWSIIANFYIETHSLDLKNKIMTLLISYGYDVKEMPFDCLSKAGISTLLATRHYDNGKY